MAKKTPKNMTGEKASPWRWFTGPWTIVVAACTAIGAFLLHINGVLANVRELPSEVRKTSDQFSSWYYEDEAWSGYWTNNPEGYVDAADMNLSQTPVGISLKVDNGNIDGMISTRLVCDSIPFFDFLLLRGQVDTFGDSATVIVWDTIEGHDRNFAKLKLKRNGIIMAIEPKEGAVRLFPQARIALDPSTKEWPAEFCEGKQQAMMKIMERVAKEVGAQQRPTPNTRR